MKSIEGILKLAENEFDTIVKNGKFRSREEIDSVYKLMDIVKDAHCIWKYEDEESEYDDESSYGNGNYRDSRSYDRDYDDGMSMARGRRNARRDSMGRYTSRDGSYNDGSSYRGGRGMNYSRNDAKQEYIDNLREAMDKAQDEQTRQAIQRMIQQAEQI